MPMGHYVVDEGIIFRADSRERAFASELHSAPMIPADYTNLSPAIRVS
jgi:hypothetical protein